MHRVLFVASILLAWSCSNQATEKKLSKAESIVDSAVSFYSQSDIKQKKVSFDFRNRNYSVEWPASGVRYESRYTDSIGHHTRILENGAYKELLDGREVKVVNLAAENRSSSVNSVLYFALLPLHLQDEAVVLNYQGTEEIADRTYEKVEVRFAQEGGGEDFEDVFLYWFDVEDYSLDYLAYSYIEDEGGTRFRKAYNSRRVNGVIFQDYENYKGPAAPDSLEFIADLFKAGKLPILSNIELTGIRVEE